MRKFVGPQQDELNTILTDKIEIRTNRRVTTVACRCRLPITVWNTGARGSHLTDQCRTRPAPL